MTVLKFIEKKTSHSNSPKAEILKKIIYHILKIFKGILLLRKRYKIRLNKLLAKEETRSNLNLSIEFFL